MLLLLLLMVMLGLLGVLAERVMIVVLAFSEAVALVLCIFWRPHRKTARRLSFATWFSA